MTKRPAEQGIPTSGIQVKEPQSAWEGYGQLTPLPPVLNKFNRIVPPLGFSPIKNALRLCVFALNPPFQLKV